METAAGVKTDPQKKDELAKFRNVGKAARVHARETQESSTHACESDKRGSCSCVRYDQHMEQRDRDRPFFQPQKQRTETRG